MGKCLLVTLFGTFNTVRKKNRVKNCGSAASVKNKEITVCLYVYDSEPRTKEKSNNAEGEKTGEELQLRE